jgi:hypothetical protein
MHNKIEEAFNACFERLSAGESLDSCLRDYPQHAVELDLMLRTTYDVKRRAYPIQPRPEFKYWARVRLQGVQDYSSRHPVQPKPSPFNLRRNLAISMAALLVFVIASSGTVAASSGAMPDEPLYGVKLAVEQAQVTFALSDVDRAEVYAHLAEKRAGEIVAMARQGKIDQMATATTKLDYQLEQAEHFISKYEAANSEPAGESAAASVAPSAITTPAPQATFTAPDKSASAPAEAGRGQDNITLPPKPFTPPTQAATNIHRAKNTMNTSTAKSLAVLQNALEKAPESAKPALLEVIQHTRTANERARHQLNLNGNDKSAPPVNKSNVIPAVPGDKPKYVAPLNNNLKPYEQHTNNKPNVQNVLPQGSVNNQTGTTDNSSGENSGSQTDTSDDRDDDNRLNQVQPGTNLRLPALVNTLTK